jgi:hypothetical protein
MAFYSNYEDKYHLANMILKEEIQRRLDDCRNLALENVKGEHSFKNNLYECIFDNNLKEEAMDYFASMCAPSLLDAYHYKGEEKPYNYQLYFCKMSAMNLLSIAKFWAQQNYDLSPLSFAKSFSDYATGWMANLEKSNDELTFTIVPSHS